MLTPGVVMMSKGN